LINQPYRFLRNLLKSSDKVLFITNIIDIIVISIVVYYVGGLSFTFAGFLYLIVIVFNGIFGGTTRALVLAILSSLAVIFLYIFETLEILYHPTLITFQISELQKVVLLISYIAIFFIFAVLAHIPSQKLRNELIKQHKITAELEQQYFITEILYKITNTVIRAESIEEVYQQTLDGITKALNINKASILLFDPDGVMRFKAWVGLSENYRKAVEGHSPWKPRSEERRVGKECRSRWSPYH